LIGSAITTRAQTYADASILLKQAAHAEMVTGDIDRAISIYRQVAESVAASRENVAKALIALGSTYELIGSGEARAVYNRVVSEFSDQSAAFLTARDGLIRLSRLVPAGEDSEPVIRQDYMLVMEQIPPIIKNFPRQYDFSPDGKTVVVSDYVLEYRKKQFPKLEKELYFIEVGSTVMHPVIEDAGDWESQRQPRWSPDGKHILFEGNKILADGPKHMGVRLDLETNEMIHHTNIIGSSWEWMPDSKQFITQARDGFHLYSSDGSEIRNYDVEISHLTRIGSVSPDGRYLTYNRIRSDSEFHSETNIWMLDLTNGDDTQITDYDGYEGWSTWSRDGSSIYYTAGEESVWNVYRKAPELDSVPEKITSYSNAQVMYPIVLSGSGQLTFALVRDNHTILTAPTDAVESPVEVMRGAYPLFSPDGKTLYFWDYEPGRAGIWSATVTGQNPKQLVSGKVSMGYGKQSFLSPDGDRIAYFLMEGNQMTLYTMPSSGGTARRLYTSDGQNNLVPAWSPDGKEIAFTDGPDLMVLSAQGGRPQSLAKATSWEGWTLEWSPDGENIAAFAYTEEDKENVLYVVNRHTTELKRLTPPEELAYKEILAWHPDGDRISYMYYDPDSGRWPDGSRIVSLSSGKSQTLAQMPDPMWDYMGYWGPDLRYYFLSVGWSTSWGLYAVDEKTNEYTTIRQLKDRSVSLPTWSSDGSWMAWSEQESSRQLWMLTDYE